MDSWVDLSRVPSYMLSFLTSSQLCRVAQINKHCNEVINKVKNNTLINISWEVEGVLSGLLVSYPGQSESNQRYSNDNNSWSICTDGSIASFGSISSFLPKRESNVQRTPIILALRPYSILPSLGKTLRLDREII